MAKNPDKSRAGKKGNKASRHPARAHILAEHKRQIMEMRLRGQDFRTIGRAIGLGPSRTWEIYEEALEESAGENARLANRIRKKQLHALNGLTGKVYGLLMDGKLVVRQESPDGSVMELSEFEALNKLGATWVKLSEREAKLAGADAAEQVNLTGDKQITFEELYARLHPKNQSNS